MTVRIRDAVVVDRPPLIRAVLEPRSEVLSLCCWSRSARHRRRGDGRGGCAARGSPRRSRLPFQPAWPWPTRLRRQPSRPRRLQKSQQQGGLEGGILDRRAEQRMGEVEKMEDELDDINLKSCAAVLIAESSGWPADRARIPPGRARCPPTARAGASNGDRRATRWNDMPKEALNPLLERRLIATERMMLAHVYLRAGLRRSEARARERAADLHPRGRRCGSGSARTSLRSSTSPPARCSTSRRTCRTRPRRWRRRSTSTSSARRGRTGSTGRTPTFGRSEPRARRQGRARLRLEPRARPRGRRGARGRRRVGCALRAQRRHAGGCCARDRAEHGRRRARRRRPISPSPARRRAPSRPASSDFGRLDIARHQHRRAPPGPLETPRPGRLGSRDGAPPAQHGRARREPPCRG